MEAQANEQTRVSRKEEWGAAEENSVPQHGLSGKTHVYLANCCGSSKMGRLMYTAPTGGGSFRYCAGVVPRTCFSIAVILKPIDGNLKKS
jgi:hypothetical protein